MPFVNKADEECKRIVRKILTEGGKDISPRAHWKDGTPAHTLSINGVMSQYDISKGEFPLLTLRPVVVKMSIAELLWIYQKQSNSLDLLKEMGVTWWDPWDIGDRTIGSCYGETVRRHDLMNYLLNSISDNPDSRYHIINLWQVSDFEEPHGLKPCCYQTNFNVRHMEDGDYLDMSLYQRSCDYLTAGCTVNQLQYCIFMHLIANHFGYKPGIFTWFAQNVQIYDRHLENAKIMLERESIECHPYVSINPDKKDFYSLDLDDIKIMDYPIDKIKEINPQLKFEVAI